MSQYYILNLMIDRRLWGKNRVINIETYLELVYQCKIVKPNSKSSYKRGEWVEWVAHGILVSPPVPCIGDLDIED